MYDTTVFDFLNVPVLSNPTVKDHDPIILEID